MYNSVAGTNFGDVIKKSGLINNQGTLRIFVCNNDVNNPLGNGIVLLFHSSLFWREHPTYLHIVNTTIKTGQLDCSDLTNIKKVN